MLSALVTLPAMPRKPLPQTEKRVPLGARILPSLLTALRELADEDRRTLSFMVEDSIREYVERRAKRSAGGGSGGGGGGAKSAGHKPPR